MEKSVDSNVENIKGETPLHVACKLNAPIIIRQLLNDRQTDPTKKNNEGKADNQVTELTEMLTAFMQHDLKREVMQSGTLEVALG